MLYCCRFLLVQGLHKCCSTCLIKDCCACVGCCECDTRRLNDNIQVCCNFEQLYDPRSPDTCTRYQTFPVLTFSKSLCQTHELYLETLPSSLDLVNFIMLYPFPASQSLTTCLYSKVKKLVLYSLSSKSLPSFPCQGVAKGY